MLRSTVRLASQATLILLLGIAVSARSDWPQFRGPDGQGHATGKLPLHWGSADHIVWKTSVPGLAWSSPVIAQGRIFLTTATDQGNAENPAVDLGVACLDEKTGKELWRKTLFSQLGKVEMHKKNSHASPTPIIDGDDLYVHFGPHGTARLTRNGDIVWKTSLEYLPTHGNGGSPALAKDLLIICCDGHDEQYVVGIETKTGRVRWKTPRGTTPEKGFSFGTPLVLEINGRQQAVCPGSDAVFAYDPATGKEIWHADYPGGYSVVPRPVYGNGLVYICTGYNKPKLLAIDPTGTGDVTETHIRWTTEKQVPHTPSLLLMGKNLFFVSDKGIACCVDALTGESHWQERLGGNYSASPLGADGRVYFQDENGTAIVVAADAKFQELARNHLPEDERTFASYAIDKDALFLRSEKHLYRIEE
jgi:outer membrane protein assembly factor BamB